MRQRRGGPRQVGTGKANASEPLMTRRDEEMASKPGYPNNPGIRPGGCPSIGQVMPGVKVARARSAASAWNVGRQAPIRPRDRGSFRAAVRGSASTGENRKVLSTVVASAGGPARSSGEPPVMGGERRGRVIYEVFTRATGEVFREETSGQVRSGQTTKSFEIPKQLVWEAYRRVAANKGAAGVDGVSIEVFEKDLKNNLYKVWNRMSSGTYFPPPVKSVDIPKPGGGTRTLGVPTVADRIAQTVVAMTLEARTEAIFHEDSYGYRPRRSALDAVGMCRSRCQKKNWVLDLDIEKFFDSVNHDRMVKAVAANTDQPWVVLYVKRWLTAALQLPDGTLQQRDRGTPQGSALTPPTQLAISASRPR